MKVLTAIAAGMLLAGGLALPGSSAVAAQDNSTQEQATALRCGTGVFLDGIRALEVTENGRDEVYITEGGFTKIWPVTDDYVSMARGQRVEVDKCVRPLPTVLSLMEYDDIGPDDPIGTITIRRDATVNYTFRGEGGEYRIGAVR